MMPRPIDRRSWRFAAAAVCCFAIIGSAAAGQETGCLDSLVASYLTGGQGAAAPRTQAVAEPYLGLMLERQLIADQPVAANYYTLSGFWGRNRERGLAELWRQGNTAFLSKPSAQRTGEGLIPDIQVPLPVLGKMLGSGAEIKLNGLYKFTVGGQQTVYPNNKSAYALGQQGSNLDLKIKQDYKVNLEGVVGDRVHVLIDYDSQIETEKKSKVRLRYEGKEDEIIQSLEAGDTEFSITGSSLVGGMSTVHKGLFGVKAVAKLAGLEVTAIASKDEGQSQSNSYTAGSRTDSVVIQDINYMRHQFFKLPLQPGDSLIQVRLFVCYQNVGTQTNTFWVNPIDRSWKDFNPPDTTQSTGDHIRVEEKHEPDYFTSNEPHIPARPGYLYLRQGLGEEDQLCAAFLVQRNGTRQWVPDTTITVNDTTKVPNVIFLKPPHCHPPDPVNGYAWDYELRNFYYLRSSQITPASLRVRLQKQTSGNVFIENDSSSRRSFLDLIGLDADHNGIIDLQWVKLGEDGYFFTPDEQPFAAMPDTNGVIYRTATLQTNQSKYQFVANYQSSGVNYRFLSTTGRLIDGSVKVFLNGALVPASDYRVDYDIGEIEFTNEEIKSQVKQPGAQLRIDYQFLPSFALGSKTLVGVRGVYKFSDKAVLGGTWLYRSEQTPEDRPRLGEEPRRIIVAGVDGSVEANPDLLTRAADALPLVETEVPSSVRLAGEFAANFPNPNTKGQVYVDDMDGAKQSDGLVMDRRYWSHSSLPPGKLDTMFADQCYWYNPTVKPTQGQINPEITDPATKKDPVSTMMLHVKPHGADTGSWGGITTVISKSGMDFTERKILNVWVKGNAGRLHIDLGKEISEDQVWRRKDILHPTNKKFDSEPLAPDGTQTSRNDNDVGLDGVSGNDSTWVPGSPDDGNDDFDGNDLSKVNGTERNGQFDTEDLLGTGRRPGDSLAAKDNYYTFDTSLALPDANIYGWHKYSIPLDNAIKVGAPYDWNNIFFARIWVDQLTAAADVELALVEVSGNQWIEQRIAKRDTAALDTIQPGEKFAIGVKNNRDDADYSSNPPFDPGKDANGNVKFEQSLSFNIYNLRPGHVAMASKSLRVNENNYTGYRTLRVYVKGESSQDTFFVRLVANDSTNYYQYLAPTAPGWQDISIDLDRLSSLKKAPYNGSRQDGAYGVKGVPNLLNVSKIVLGVIPGPGHSAGGYTGQVWFDELRLDNVRMDRGTSYFTTATINMADLLTLSGRYSQVGSHWYTMGDGGGRGSGVQSMNYNFSAGLTASKFYLDRLGFSLPLTFTQTVTEGLPEFGNDDIRLTPAESKAQRTWDRSRSAGFSLSRTKPAGLGLLDFLEVEHLAYNLGWSQRDAFSSSTVDSSRGLNQSLGYSWTPRRNDGLRIFKGLKFYYLPSSLSSEWRSNQTQVSHLEKTTGVSTNAGSGMARTLSGALGWKLTDQLNYGFSQNRDLTEEKWNGGLARRFGLGTEIGRNQHLEFNTTLSWLKVVAPTVNYTTTYSETHAILLLANSRDSLNVQNVSNVNALTVGSDFPVGSWLSKLTGLRNANKDTAAEAGSPRWMLIGLDRFFRDWSGVQVSFSQNKSGAASGLISRPNLWYQFGWERQPASTIARPGQSTPDNLSLANTYSANSQARIGPVNLTGSWSRSDSWTTAGAVTNYGQTVNWPNVRADVISVEKAWPQAWTSSRLSSSYNQTLERSFQQDRGQARTALRRNFSPLIEWSCTWKPRFSTSLNYEWTTQDIHEPNTGYFSGWRRDYSDTKKLTGNFSYAFTAQKGFSLNLWKLGRKRFKFANELRLSLSGSYGVRTQKILDAQSPLDGAPYTANTQEMAVSTQAEYRFSNSITGSLSANYGSTANKVYSVSDSKQYGLNLLVNVVF